MTDGTFIVPSPQGSSWSELSAAPLELARSSQGRLFEKHILNTGSLIHPKTGEKIPVDARFMDSMIRNFSENVCDIVQVPLANDKNEHVESPVANIGETVALRRREGKLYAIIDARDPEAANRLGKTYLGASAFLSTNYTDSRTGKKAGPTLLHVAVTNRPYVVGLEPYKEIAALTADSGDDELIVLTPEELHVTTPVMPTKEELLAQLKEQHGIDVAALQATASQGVDAAALTEALSRALESNPVTAALAAGGADTITPSDLAGAVVELSRQNAVISKGYEDMRTERATERVQALIRDGYILPKQKAIAIKLALTSPEDFAEFVPAEKIVPVDEQAGLSAEDDTPQVKASADEVSRLTAAYTEYFDHEAAAAKARPRGRRH